MRQKRVLFLLSDTGGGHRAAAQAMTEALQSCYPGQYRCFLDDLWQHHTPCPISHIPRTYPWLISGGLPLWRLMWRVSVSGQLHSPFFRAMLPLVKRPIAAYFQQVKPDVIVCVHPWMNHIGVAVQRAIGLDVPFLTVVTDLVSVHPAWACPEVTHCTVPTETAYQRVRQFGLSASQVSLIGQPVSPKFAELRHCDKATLRHSLQLEPDRPMVLITNGGEGIGHVGEIAEAVAHIPRPIQLVVVTGRNQSLKHTLQQRPWPIPVKIYGFVNQIAELMHAADMVITKAGPHTISEALIAGLPMIICGYIPGQEYGNVQYVQAHEVGVFAPHPPQIATLVVHWLSEGTTYLQQMAHHAAAIARPHAALQIAQLIHQW